MIKFKIDDSVKFEVEVEKGTKSRVWNMWNEGGMKDMIDVLGPTQYMNIKSAVEFLLKEPKTVSAKTICGLIVTRA